MLKNKKIIILLSLIIVTPIIINVFMSIETPWVKGDIGDWISFSGSYIGALLGALVAFQVANMQIKAQEKINRREIIINQLPYLVMIKIEIEKTIEFINILNNITKSNLPGGTIVENLRFENPMEINEENWIGIDKLTDKGLLVDLVIFKEKYKKLCESIKINSAEEESELRKINLIIQRLQNKSKRNDKEEVELYDYEHKRNNLLLRLETVKYNREYGWKCIEDGDLLNKANSILKVIIDNINNIEKIITKA